MRCAIVVPTYNEASTIGALMDAIGSLREGLSGTTLDLIVVDDGSPDGTQDVVRSRAAGADWVHLLPRPGKAGIGAAYRAGFAAAARAGYDVVVQMDADGSHAPASIPALLARLQTNDVAIGSRYVRGGRAPGWPARRRALSRAANAYARGVLGLRTRDVTSGFRAWRTAAVVAAGVGESQARGYAFQIETTWSCERRGLRVAEHPIVFVDRTAGESKLTAAEAWEAAVSVLRWRLRRSPRRLAARSTAPAGGAHA